MSAEQIQEIVRLPEEQDAVMSEVLDEHTDIVDAVELPDVDDMADVPPDDPEVAQTDKSTILRFRFCAGDNVVRETMSASKFLELSPLQRVLFAVGQHSSFRTNTPVMDYIRRVANKGAFNGSCLSEEELSQLLTKASNDGLIQHEDEGIHLTNAALEHVVITQAKRNDAANRSFGPMYVKEYEEPMSLTERFTKSEIAAAAATIGPVTLARYQEIKKLKFRALDTLGAIAMMNGTVASKRLDFELRRLAGLATEAKIYKLNLAQLVDAGMVDLRTDKVDGEKIQVATLTEQGAELVADIMKNPDILKKKMPNEKLTKESMYEVISMFADMLDYEPGKWLRPEKSLVPIDLLSLARSIGQSEEVFMKRFYCARRDKGYLEVMKDHEGKVYNVRLTEKGLEYLLRLEQRDYDELPVGEKIGLYKGQIQDLQLRQGACMKFADQLGRRDIFQQVKKLEFSKDPRSLNLVQFHRAKRAVDRALEELERVETASEHRHMYQQQAA